MDARLGRELTDKVGDDLDIQCGTVSESCCVVWLKGILLSAVKSIGKDDGRIRTRSQIQG